jgi:primosomal protein N' (replication factor Y)
MPAKKIVKVALPLKVDKEFDYYLEAEQKPLVGSRLAVKFRNQKKIAIALTFSTNSKFKKIKPVTAVLDKADPCLDDEHLQFAKLVAQRYLCCWGEIIFLMLPPSLKQSSRITNLKAAVSLSNKVKPKPEFIYGRNFKVRFSDYCKRIVKAREEGSALIVVPFIAAAEAAASLLRENFKQQVVVIHSGLKSSQLLARWQKIKSGGVIIVGTHLSLFYYPPDLSLIIVDDASNPYYFNSEKPYYNGSELSWLLYQLKGVNFVVGGLAPGVSTYRKIKQGQIKVVNKPPAKSGVKIFDLDNFRSSQRGIFNPFIIELIRHDLEQEGKILILWRRKQFSSILRCGGCGHILECQRCSRFLKFSLAHEAAICPYCGYREAVADICPKCNQDYIRPRGVGIERLEKIVKKIFPEYNIATAAEANNQTRIILATAAIVNRGAVNNAKFSSCFVLDIDYFLSQVDFQATFNAYIYLKKLSFLAQNLYIFTNASTHYLWRGLQQSMDSFYQQELKAREQLSFPPYGVIAKIILRAKTKKNLLKQANNLYNDLDKNLAQQVFGPLEETPHKLRDFYRYAVVVKGRNHARLAQQLRPFIAKYRKYKIKISVSIK